MEAKPSLGIQRRRRNRTRTSCQACRARKSKCDGHRPCCLACLSRGRPDQCAYENPRPGPHRRVSIREIPHLPPDSAASTKSPLSMINGIPLVANTEHRAESNGKDSIGTRHEKATESKEGVYRDEAAFGPPSTHSFINRIIASIEPCSKASTPASKASSGKPFLSDPIGFTVSNADNVRLDMDSLLLPEKGLADSLMSTYFVYSHQIFPVLHRPTFMKRYDNLWKSTEPNDTMLLAMVNAALAIGCQRRSVRLISAETLDSYTYTFDLMQLYLLRVIYLQYTSFASQCWSTLGIAQRVAYGLGLHKDAPESMGQLEREMRRRVWHVSVILDSIASFTFGWQISSSGPNRVPMPQPIDDEYLAEEGEDAHQPLGKASKLDFFRYYRGMCDVPKEIADNINLVFQNLAEQDSTSLLTTYVSELPRYSLRLDELLGNLPSHLQEANEDAVDECFQIQGQILRIRSMYVRLTILRPCLLATVANRAVRSELRRVKAGQSTSLTMGLLDDVNKSCVSTARTIIDQVYKRFLTVWRASTWHTLRVTMGSATVLLAASLVPDLDVDLDQEPNKTSWEQAIAIFELYTSYDVSAQGGIQALLDYRQKFEATKRRGEPSTEVGCAEPRPCSRGDGVVAGGDDTLPGMDGVFFGDDLSQAFYDWNWLDFDIPELLLS